MSHAHARSAEVSTRSTRSVLTLIALVTALSGLAGLTTLATVGPARGSGYPVEAYAGYEPQTTCSPTAKPGTVTLGRYLVRTYGGRFGPISRACGGSLSEHKEGRAFDWVLKARKKADRARAHRFLAAALATGPTGQRAELARRMGIMYIIWNDRMYPAYNGFQSKPYLSRSCPSLKRCSVTLRHRDHVHISLTRAGGAGTTSWYAGRIPGVAVIPAQPPVTVPPTTPAPPSGG